MTKAATEEPSVMEAINWPILRGTGEVNQLIVNSSGAEAGIFREKKVNTMATDALATQEPSVPCFL